MRDLLLLAAVAVAAVVGLWRPSFGILAFIFLGLLGPQSYTWEFGRTFPFSQVIAVSTVLGMFVSAERKAFILWRETVLLILFWGVIGISTLFALYPENAFARFQLVSKILLMTIIATFLINSEEKFNALIRMFGYCIGFYGLKGGLFAVASGGELIVYGPEGTFLAANNSIGLALALNIPILLYLQRYEKSPWLRWLSRGMLIFSYPAIVCTYSRGAWLGMVVVTTMCLLKSKNRCFTLAIGTLIGLGVLVIIPQMAPDRLVQRYDDLLNYQEEVSAQSRLWNWEFCTRVGLERPFVGGGFDFYTAESYARYYPEFQDRWPGKVWSCHSTWLTILGEHGVPGAVIWLSLLISTFLSLRQIRVYCRRNAEYSHLASFSDMARNSIVSFCITGSFLDAAYFDLFYYFVGFTVMLKVILAADKQNVVSPGPVMDSSALQRQSIGLVGAVTSRTGS